MKNNRPFAYGESDYDFSGRPAPKSLDNFYHNYYDPNDPGTVDTPTQSSDKANTTKTLLFIALGAVVLTGTLIFLLGRRK